MRLFIAIELPQETKSRIQALAQDLFSSMPDSKKALRWVPSDQYHLTLKFLGERPTESVTPLKAALEPVAKSQRPFDLQFQGIGSFESRKLIRAIWLGIDQGAESTVRLASEIEEACKALGIAKDVRSYTPHLTLARTKEPFPALGLRNAISPRTMTAIEPVTITKLSLIQSVLSHEGPRYKTLQEFPFQSAGVQER